jgi:peptide/nickel transport system ATP-binding protein
LADPVRKKSLAKPADFLVTTAERASERSAMSNLVSVQDLRVSFRLGKHRVVEAVRGVSFEVPENGTVALVGESGSGKTVSAMSVVRLLPENAIVGAASRISFAGRDILTASDAELRAIRGKDISVIFQEPMTSLNPVYTVGWQIAEVLSLHTDLSGRALADRVFELMNEVGIPEPRARIDAYPHELSGGQQQRVMIAMAIACEPRLLIADEPTTALDVTVQRQILELMARLRAKHRMSMLFISHDLGLVGEIADTVVVMRDGIVRESGPVAQIFAAPQDPYTKALLLCRPRLDAKPKRLPVIDDFMRGAGAAPQIVVETRQARPQEARPLIEAKGLRKEYSLKTGLLKRKTIEAVKDASFSLYRGRTLGVVGESGSGKTTVGMMLMRLTQATAGQVLYDGTDLLALTDREMMAFRRRIQIIFQNPYASLNPRFTVGQILTEPMKIHGIGSNDADRFEQAIALARRVGLPDDSVHKYPHEFSGGQRQRIAIARCLSMKPEVLICDESVSALDVSVQATVLNLLLDLQDEFGMTYVFISHDLAVVKYMADDMLVMNEGAIVERGAAEAIYADPQNEYTRKLMNAIPRGFAGRPARVI